MIETVTPGAELTRHELGNGKSHLHRVFATVTAEDAYDEIAAYERARSLLAALDTALEQAGTSWLWLPLLVSHGATFTVWCCQHGNR